jgi:hypothetical protein
MRIQQERQKYPHIQDVYTTGKAQNIRTFKLRIQQERQKYPHIQDAYETGKAKISAHSRCE